MVELYTGMPLFPSSNSLGERLLLIEKILGIFPMSLARSVPMLFDFSGPPRIDLVMFAEVPADTLKKVIETPSLRVCFTVTRLSKICR